MNPRETTEAREDQLLAPYAARSATSRGRTRPEPRDSIRTDFQRDRDRVVHSKAFRRLMHKTQVFIAPEGDHYRTRLTHTLEVAQIARTIARALRLNEDLTEAIVLAHDLGHPPFGHAGEEALNEMMAGYGGFRHDVQSLRVVERLERRRTSDGTIQHGLNLTWEVRDGIGGHSKGHSDLETLPSIDDTPAEALPHTVEGQLARVSDRIAYMHHDADDAIRAGLIGEQDVPAAVREVLGETPGRWVDATVRDIVERSAGRPRIEMGDTNRQALNRLKDFLFERVYLGSAAKADVGKAQRLLRELFDYFVARPDEMGDEARGPRDGQCSVQRAVCDFLAGMTDRFAIRTHERLFVPRAWE